MQDKLIVAIDQGKNISVHFATSQHLVAEACRRHHTSPTASAALGRLLTVTVMMGHDLKAEQASLTLRVEGNGPGGIMIATADAKGHVRGMIACPQADVPSKYPGKLDVGGLVGTDGYLEVIKDSGQGSGFSGKVDLVSGEIGEDLANYYYRSEQIPALVAVGVLVERDLSIAFAAGLIVQALPEADDRILKQVEENIFALGPISSWGQVFDRFEDALQQVMQGISYEILETLPISFRCNCSHERLKGILSRFSPEELETKNPSEEDDHHIIVTCEFCGEVYNFMLTEIGIE